MVDYTQEAELLNSISNDSLTEFISHIKNINEWEKYFLKNEKEYLIHYAASKLYLQRKKF
jgi:hypothetical protein